MAEQCGAKTRGGGKCKRPPVKGNARCSMHGGHAGRPLESGRYSKIANERLGSLIDRHGQIEDPLNLLPELALIRAILEDYINRYDIFTEALIHWHEDTTKKAAKPVQVLDIADSYRILSEVTKIVKRIEDVKANNAITSKDFYRLIEQMGISVRAHVKDEVILEKIAEEWRAMKY